MSALLTLSSLLCGKVTTVSWCKTEPLVSVTRSLCSISLAVLDLPVITIVPPTVEGVSLSTPKEALREQEEESRASAVLDLATLPHKLRWTMRLEDLSEMNLCSPVVSWLTVSEIPNNTFPKTEADVCSVCWWEKEEKQRNENHVLILKHSHVSLSLN